ncbi:MAG: hypothetical protein ABSG25_01295 [Bryobacteraceae bacterium]
MGYDSGSESALVTAQRPKAAAWRILVFAALATAVLGVCWFPGFKPPQSDGGWYRMMAQGHTRDVYFYYAGRILHPLVVRTVSALTGLDTTASFFAVGVAALGVLFGCLGLLLNGSALPRPVPAVLLCCPAVLIVFQNYYGQELFHAALVAAFFLAFCRNRWAALPLLFACYITRESTILLSLAAIAIALRYKRRGYAIALAATTACGMFVVSAAVSQAIPNKHQLNPVLMYALKVPYNVCYNLLGLVFWTDTNAATTLCIPARTAAVPAWLHLGAIHTIGFCGFSPSNVFGTAVSYLATFGIGPALAICLFTGKRRALASHHDETVSVALLYGVLALVAAAVIGNTPERYVLYAWPLFWLAMPTVLVRAVRLRSRDWLILGALYVSAAWLPFVIERALAPGIHTLGFALIAALACNAYAFTYLMRAVSSAKAAAPTDAASVTGPLAGSKDR